jgi:hypothetical protein
MGLSDAQVLAQLKVRRVKLKMELDRIEVAIKAFENIDVEAINMLDALPYMVEDIQVDDEFAEALLMYNPKDTIEKKIIYILGKIKSGSASDIAEYLLRIDGHIKDTSRVYSRITYVASRMFRTGKITAERTRKKNIYRLW